MTPARPDRPAANDPAGSAPARSVLVLGGTGFIGYHATLEFLRRGYDVTAVGLPGPSAGAPLPPAVRVVLADVETMPDPELGRLLSGQWGVVYAAGVDDRCLPRAPAWDFFYAGNVRPAARFFRIARVAGARRGVLLSSYFSHFARAWPELDLADRHPYIRSRIAQEAAALEASRPDLELVILQLPYVLGAAPGARPLWAPLVRYVRAMPVVLYTGGGTNMVAVRHVAEAVAGAVESGRPGGCYVVGERNVLWRDFLSDISALAGRRKRVVTLPRPLVSCAARAVRLAHRLRGRESGLDPVEFMSLQTARTFVDVAPSRRELGYGTGGYDDALRDTVRSSLGGREDVRGPAFP